MRPLKYLILFFLLAVIFVEGGFIKKKLEATPCDVPIGYRIGNIDSRFKVITEKLLDVAQRSANVWNQEAGKVLFGYDSKAKLTINLVYDERQSLTEKIQNLDQNLKNERGALDPEVAQYKLLVADFKKRLSDFNSKVAYWNSKGGAPPEEYTKLTSEQAELRNESDKLNLMAKELNQSTQKYNINVSDFNQTLNSFNDVLSQKPEEGIYRGAEDEIDIYLTKNDNEFVHTLAHELGHALGIPHNNDEKSIMFPFTSESVKATEADTNDLSYICRKRTVVEGFREFVKARELF